MATIIANERDGRIVSFKFKVCLGRDEQNKQIMRCKTWYPTKEMTKNQMRKEASVAALVWEIEQRQQFSFDSGRPQKKKVEKAALTFSVFTTDVWLPLAVYDGAHRTTTIEMYKHILAKILPVLGTVQLNEITPLQITKYLQWLRKDYRTNTGKTVSESTVKHHYDILRIMFSYNDSKVGIVIASLTKHVVFVRTEAAGGLLKSLADFDSALFSVNRDSCHI